MGLYFRKNISFGGLRLNLSKSGIGTSFGVKGFRISTGPRGTFATVGSNGFYYRERIDAPKRKADQTSPKLDQSKSAQPEQSTIRTSDVSQLVESSSEKVLSEINQRKAKTPLTPFILGTSGLLALVLLSSQAVLAFGIVCLLGILLTFMAHQSDHQRRTTSLHYELDGDLAKRFSMLESACESLGKSQRIWRVETQQSTWDWKRNAGASSLINRREITVGRLNPPFIETNL